MKQPRLNFVFLYLATCFLVLSLQANEATEPTFDGLDAIDLLAGGTMDAWKVPSDRWQIKEGHIVGHTGGERLEIPEWLYTRQRFGDFAFTCEVKLSGENRRNSGIYYRVNIIVHPGTRKIGKPFEAPSGYEFDFAFHNPAAERNYTGSLGDWYVRPSLRIYPDQALINQVFQQETWNRYTLRARGNRLEYWINGVKVMDFVDPDPKGSREGVIGFQIHDGAVMQVECRNIRALPLPPK